MVGLVGTLVRVLVEVCVRLLPVCRAARHPPPRTDTVRTPARSHWRATVAAAAPTGSPTVYILRLTEKLVDPINSSFCVIPFYHKVRSGDCPARQGLIQGARISTIGHAGAEVGCGRPHPNPASYSLFQTPMSARTKKNAEGFLTSFCSQQGC